MSEHRVDPWKVDYVEPTAPYDGRCRRCGDTGIWLTPMGVVTECPNLQLRFNDHPSLGPAAEMVLRSGRHVAGRGLIASPHCFDLARALTKAHTAAPAQRDDLIKRHFAWSGAGKLREFHKFIEQLRREWLLPVASRKSDPAGYWIAVAQHDFADWLERTAKAPRTQLTTIFRLAKTHWPVYGKQLELEFGDHLAMSEVETIAA